jgi:phosphatidylinositol glycan class B
MTFPEHHAPRAQSTAAAIIAAAAGAQIFLAVRYFGFFIGDDMEMVARAFDVARGIWYGAWDIRCLFVPDVIVATPVRIAARFGVTDNVTLLGAATALFIVISALTNWLVYRLALRWSDDEFASVAAMALYAFHWIPLGFGSMVFPRIVSTCCIVAAALLVSDDRKSAHVIAGVLVAIAFADRFSEIVFFLPLLLVARRRVLFLIATITAIVIIVGGYDWYTWGHPFGSLVKFAQVTIIHPDFASRVKYQSPLWYIETLVRWCALTLIPLAWFGRRFARWSFIVVPLVVLSIVRHKEMRYVAGVLPFLMIAAAVGFAWLWRADHRVIAAVLLATSIAWDLYGLRYLARKSMPAVAAARAFGNDPRLKTVVVSQLWAFGDRLFLPPRLKVYDVSTPPEHLEHVLPLADTAMLYESDLTPEMSALLRSSGFTQVRRFDDGRARAVIVYQR